MEVLWLAAFCLLSVAEELPNPELSPGSRNVEMGSTVTIRCRWKNASLPITFILFQNTSTKGRVTMSKKGGATFNVTLYNHTGLGPYKCKANNSASPGLYSKSFTFQLQEHTTHGPGPTEELPNPELSPGSHNVEMGSTVTIRCRWKNASLPITFILFQNTSTKERVTMSKKGGATFNVTLYNHTGLGPYKCKANNSASPGLYSKSFTFQLQEHTTHGQGPTGGTGGGGVHLAWIIPLLVLVILSAVFVFWRISTPHAEQEPIEEENTYENVSERQPETRREEEVLYSTVIVKEGNRDVTCAEETVEYSVTLKRPQVQQQP